MKRSIIAGSCIMLLLLALALEAAATSYMPIVLPKLGPYGSMANAINDSGQIAGWSTVCSENLTAHACLWQNGDVIDLGTLGGQDSRAFGLNEKGQVVGEASTASGSTHACLWQDGTIVDLGMLPGAVSSRAVGINNNDQIVGISWFSDGGQYGCLWQNGAVTNLGLGAALGINDKGQVAGFLNGSASGNGYGYIWQNGAVTDAFIWTPSAINSSGEVAGCGAFFYEEKKYTTDACLWRNGTLIDLDTLGGAYGRANGINDSGQVVGYCCIAPGQGQAFVWQDGIMTGLGGVEANAINNRGQIVGSYGPGPILWQPIVAGPSTDVALLFGIGGLLSRSFAESQAKLSLL